ncbi:Gametocyte-specific factor 1 [Orchesella cincta]|uniref:Gametocyte-specific factor 1 n=1 Tax=Orchesella cincta TaxID=48709 RepID=A0A1D2NBR6_ORCCI|nr:Gametocyte-specific factor 1 [Orchesella cincta]
MTTPIVNGRYVCPYNKSHMVTWLKLPNHLVRCRNANPSLADKIDICLFNRCHHVPKEKMEEHLRECKDAHVFQHLSYQADSSSDGQSFHRQDFDIVVERRREPLSEQEHRLKFSNPGSGSTRVSASLSGHQVDSFKEARDHLSYKAHRKLHETPVLPVDSSKIRAQKQRNLDDLDEWYAE